MSTRTEWRKALARAGLSAGARTTLLAHSEAGTDRYHDDGGNLHGCSQHTLSSVTATPLRTIKHHLKTGEDRGWLRKHDGGRYRGEQARYHYLMPGETLDCDCPEKGARRVQDNGIGRVKEGCKKADPSGPSLHPSATEIKGASSRVEGCKPVAPLLITTHCKTGTEEEPRPENQTRTEHNRSVVAAALPRPAITSPAAPKPTTAVAASTLNHQREASKGAIVRHPVTCVRAHPLPATCSVGNCHEDPQVCLGRDGVAYCNEHRMNIWSDLAPVPDSRSVQRPAA